MCYFEEEKNRIIDLAYAMKYSSVKMLPGTSSVFTRSTSHKTSNFIKEPTNKYFRTRSHEKVFVFPKHTTKQIGTSS